jgi:hypothetical protein
MIFWGKFRPTQAKTVQYFSILSTQYDSTDQYLSSTKKPGALYHVNILSYSAAKIRTFPKKSYIFDAHCRLMVVTSKFSNRILHNLLAMI